MSRIDRNGFLAILLLGLSLAVLFIGCRPSNGPFVLGEVRGRVLDLETGEPIAGAEVIEWYVGGGPSDGARPVHHARWATTDPEGDFVLTESRASLRMLAGLSYGPRFAMVHPEYGLQRQAREERDHWILEGDRRRVEQAREDLRPYCRGERQDAGAQRIREVACPPIPGRVRQ